MWRKFSTVGDIISTITGNHMYISGCSAQRGIPSILCVKDIPYYGDIMSTNEGVQHSCHLKDNFATLLETKKLQGTVNAVF